jgi:hypothetical protein
MIYVSSLHNVALSRLRRSAMLLVRRSHGDRLHHRGASRDAARRQLDGKAVPRAHACRHDRAQHQLPPRAAAAAAAAAGSGDLHELPWRGARRHPHHHRSPGGATAGDDGWQWHRRQHRSRVEAATLVPASCGVAAAVSSVCMIPMAGSS